MIEEVFIIRKNKKYLKSWGYSPNGRRFFWTANINDAYKFDPLHSDADYFATLTKSKLITLKTSL